MYEGVFNSVTAYCLSKANFENTKTVMQQPIITQDNKMSISLARRAAHISAMTFQNRFTNCTVVFVVLLLADNLTVTHTNTRR